VRSSPSVELGAKTIEILIDRNVPPYRDGKVAVNAASRAKRNMNVEMFRMHY
jgi:hypothetical protein